MITYAVARVLVLLLATVAVGSAQERGAVSRPPQASAAPPAAAMTGMMAKCNARHEAQVADVKALAKTVADARATRDLAVLHAALDAVTAHLTAMEVQAAGCAEKMKGGDHMKAKAPAAEPPQPAQPHAH
jgi:hypothetical protein